MRHAWLFFCFLTPQPPRGRPLPKLTKPVARSVAFHAITKRLAKLADRDQLAGGDSHQVDLTIVGHVDGKANPVDERVVGTLAVNHDSSSQSSVACDAEHLVAFLLDALTPAKRRSIVGTLPKRYLDNENELPAVGDEVRSQAAQLLKELRSTRSTSKRGSIVFTPAPK